MKTTVKVFALVLVVAIVASCAKTVQITMDPKSDPAILVYPLMDGRDNRSIDLTDIGGTNQLNHPLSAYYMGNNFNCITRFAIDIGIEPNISYAELAISDSAALSRVASGSNRYVLVIYVGQLDYGPGNTTVRASLEAFLIDTQTDKVRWSNKADKTQWLGLLGSLNRTMSGGKNDPAYQAYDQALAKVLRGFPTDLET